MKINRKGLLLLGCIVVIVAGSLFGTLAYLTDMEAATNTFTVGQVGLTLDEAKVDQLGQPVAGEARVRENAYHLIPGYTYTKDPTLHVSPDSSDCYLFVKVENALSAIEGGTKIATQMEELGWKPVEGVANVYIFAKGGEKYVLSKGANVEVFKTFTVDGATVTDEVLENGGYQDKEIVVTGYAVQAAGFEAASPAAIWEAALKDKA